MAEESWQHPYVVVYNQHNRLSQEEEYIPQGSWFDFHSTVSDSVKSLLTTSVKVSEHLPACIDSSGEFVVPKKEDLCRISSADTKELDALGAAALRVIDVADRIHSIVHTVNDSSLKDQYGSDIDLLGYEDLIDLYRFGDVQPRTALSIMFSYLERFLADLFEAAAPNKARPRILRDLIASDVIQRLLTADQTFFVQVMAGPPQGLNLRNLSWHGFVGDDELRPSFLSLLLVFLASLSRHVRRQACINLPELADRHLIKLDTIPPKNFDFGMGSYIFPEEMTQFDLELIKEVSRNSIFLLPGRHKLFEKALVGLYPQPGQTPHPLRFHRFASAMWPEVEHGLRRLYVGANNLPHELICADSKRFYTTIDVFISKKIELELEEYDGNHNALVDVLGPRICMALSDLLVYGDGMRPRDRISHGEAWPWSVTRVQADRLLGLVVALCMKYDVRYTKKKAEHYFSRVSPTLRRCHEFLCESYISCFHPAAVLQRTLLRGFWSLQSWNSIRNSYPDRACAPAGTDFASNDKLLYSYRRAEAAGEMNRMMESQALLVAILTAASKDGSALMDIRFCNNPESSHHPLLRGELVAWDGLFWSSDRLSHIGALQRILDCLIETFDILRAKATEFCDSYATGNPPRRVIHSYYKLLGLLDALYNLHLVVLTVVEQQLFASTQLHIPMKTLNQFVTALERMRTAASDHEFGAILDLWVTLVQKALDRFLSNRTDNMTAEHPLRQL